MKHVTNIKEVPAVTVDQAIDMLNDLLKLDREAITQLLDRRVLCSESMADHETVQVLERQHKNGKASTYTVGLLGILNGLFGVMEDGWGHISAWYEDDGTVIAFKRTPDGDKKRWREKGERRWDEEGENDG